MSDPATVGGRIAAYRRQRGVSQREFAALVGRSESWVSQVERGARRIDRLSVLHQVADELGVSVSDLSPDAPAAAPESPAYLDRLRLAVTGYGAIVAYKAETPAPGLDGIRSEVEGAWAMVHACRYVDAAGMLDELVPRLEAAVRQCEPADAPDYYEQMSVAYQATAAVFAKLDDAEATWLAGDRSVLAAERTGEPLVALAAEWRLALSLLSTRRPEQARHIATTLVEALTPQANDGPPEMVSLLGACESLLSVIAAHDNDRSAAHHHLERARIAAGLLDGDRNDFDTEFGPTNVAMHEVAVAVELGDAGHALDRAEQTDPSALSPERQARFLIDVARAHIQRRHAGDALRALLQAERIAPEQVRDNQLVRDLVRDLRRGPASGLIELEPLAHRLGLT